MGDRGKEIIKDFNAIIEKLAQEVDSPEARAGYERMYNAWKKYGMGRYSIRNSMLVEMQNPRATYVNGYKFWISHGYHPLKGKSLVIVQPLFVGGEDEDDPKRMLTRDIPVWDIKDVEPIEGVQQKPVPTYNFEWYATVKREDLDAALDKYAAEIGATVKVVEGLGGARGSTDTKTTISILADAGTATRIHEIAHFILHKNRGELDRATEEHEAEATAYVVGDAFGLPNGHALTYLVNWGADAKKIRARLTRISKAVNDIIAGVRQYLEPEEVTSEE